MSEETSYSYVVSAKSVEVLANWMEKERRSQGWLAKELGTTQSAVQRWLRNPGTVARGLPARELEKLVNKINSTKAVRIHPKVYVRLNAHKEKSGMSFDEFAVF